jgi:hypothetical protein
MPMTKKVRELVDTITGYRQALLGEVSALSQSQLDYKPGDGQWSISDILHHLALTDEANLKLMLRAVKQAEAMNLPEDPTPNESALNCLDGVMGSFNSTKAQAPGFVAPQSHLPAEQSLARLEASRAKMLESIERLAAYDLSQLKYKHPLLGDLDMYQWILIAGGHERRHAAQVGRIKAGTGFPNN